MATANDVIRIARAEVGYNRYDDPQNGTKYGRWYEKEIDGPSGYNYGANGVAYCAMFASWVLAQADAKCAGMPSAYCPSIHHSQTLAAPQLKAGDLVLFDWENDGTDDHIGIVVSNDAAARVVHTIEGNTNGGKVAERTRAYSAICGGVRPQYGGSAADAATEIGQGLVLDVIDGKYGNGSERVSRLAAAGYDARAVQLAVNAYLRGGCFGEEQAAPAAPYTITTKSGVNVREGAGTRYAKTGKAYAKGATVSVMDTADEGGNTWGKTPDGWFAIRYQGDTYAQKA